MRMASLFLCLVIYYLGSTFGETNKRSKKSQKLLIFAKSGPIVINQQKWLVINRNFVPIALYITN